METFKKQKYIFLGIHISLSLNLIILPYSIIFYFITDIQYRKIFLSENELYVGPIID